MAWQPIYVDLDLNSDETSPPGCISASIVNQTLPCDQLTQTMSLFHGSNKIVTQEFLATQMTELSNAVRGKLQNDLSDFLHTYDGAKECVASPIPEVFCSGTIINGFTPLNKRETDSLLFAIKSFKVNVVLVIDYEKLEKDV
jgi:hypothetical protein